MFAALGPTISNLATTYLPMLGKQIGGMLLSSGIPFLAKKIGTFGR